MENTLNGYTAEDFFKGNKELAERIRRQDYPEGTTKEDWLIIWGDLVVYTPFIPVSYTNLHEKALKHSKQVNEDIIFNDIFS